MPKTLIILNPHAAGGLAGRLWQQIEPLLWQNLGDLVIAVTEKPDEVPLHLDKAYESGLTRVISIGGDGTNHALVNGLARLNEEYPDGPRMVYGILPVGTGRDWARSQGIPLNPEEAAHWIATAEPRPTDIGLLTYDHRREHFLNIASAGLSGEIDRRVNQTQVRRPWTFLKATVATLLTHTAQAVQVTVDDEQWYEGDAYLVAVANGTTFGHGMKIAPDARVDDGLFDVVLIEGMPRLEAVAALRRLYDASHLTHPGVHLRRGQQVRITSPIHSLGLDLDGEHAEGNNLTFTVRPGLLPILS
ncbi:MAG: diacylglycerol kinase family lipid kinase [Anaerolineae bacterium]|nr:diacylglycerol kinase family lipid kinase [Anaerolineae bacterium]